MNTAHSFYLVRFTIPPLDDERVSQAEWTDWPAVKDAPQCCSFQTSEVSGATVVSVPDPAAGFMTVYGRETSEGGRG